MTLYFITGNKNKFNEVNLLLPSVEQLNIDLPEIQDIDARNVVKAKLTEALNYKNGEFIIEDTSLYLDCLNGLPGPFVKWFLETMGSEGLATIAQKLGNPKAKTKTIIGYGKNKEELYFFEGSILGNIVLPRGQFGFGWDEIFQPDGFNKTFAEMTAEEKNSVSMRNIALEKLKEFVRKK